MRLLLSTSGDCNEINVKSLCKSSGSAFIAECLRGLGQSALEAWIEGLQQGVLTHCLLQASRTNSCLIPFDVELLKSGRLLGCGDKWARYWKSNRPVASLSGSNKPTRHVQMQSTD